MTKRDKSSGEWVAFDWTPQCKQVFQRLKKLLITAPVFQHPDLSKPFFLWTDASEAGFGAILEQEGEDKLRHPIAYARRQTNDAEKKYAPTQLEVAALVFGVEHFEVYLLGNKVTVFAYHQVLVSAFLTHLKSQTKGLLARWYLRLSKFLPNIELQFKPGTTNGAADALSLSPTEVTNVCLVCITAESDDVLVKVQNEQRKDEELKRLIAYLQDKILPEDPKQAIQIVNLGKEGYYLVDGILYYESSEVPDRRRIVIPQHLRQQVLDESHDATVQSIYNFTHAWHFTQLFPVAKAKITRGTGHCHDVAQGIATHGKRDCHAKTLQCVESSDWYVWNHCHVWLILANVLLNFYLCNII